MGGGQSASEVQETTQECDVGSQFGFEAGQSALTKHSTQSPLVASHLGVDGVRVQSALVLQAQKLAVQSPLRQSVLLMQGEPTR
jgi:hypothetical protein